jgi:hypothetical protein
METPPPPDRDYRGRVRSGGRLRVCRIHRTERPSRR